MMKRLFKGGTVVSGEGLKKIDLLVKGEKILAAGKNLEFQDAETIYVRGKLLFPGFIPFIKIIRSLLNVISFPFPSFSPSEGSSSVLRRKLSPKQPERMQMYCL